MNVKQENHIIGREQTAKVQKKHMEHDQLAAQMALNESILSKNAQIESLPYKPHFGPEEKAIQVMVTREREAKTKKELNRHFKNTVEQKSAEKMYAKNEDVSIEHTQYLQNNAERAAQAQQRENQHKEVTEFW